MFRLPGLSWIVCCGLLSSAAFGQMNPPMESSPQEPLRILVMTTGRVLEGELSERPGGYQVITPQGQYVIPFTEVMVTATSLNDAYERLRATLIRPTASDHVTLARWCIEQRLFHAAGTELQAALLLEPGRLEARQLQWQLDSILNPTAVQNVQETPARTWDRYTAAPPVAPGGLSRSTTQEFVTRIQPLMLNSCGNARCHGTAGHPPHLQFVRSSGVGGLNITTANIEALFAFVDVNDPRGSRLFASLRDPAIFEHRQLLVGPRGRDQLETIATWLDKAAIERGGRPVTPQAPEASLAGRAPAAEEITPESTLTAAQPSAAGREPSPVRQAGRLTLDAAPPISIEPVAAILPSESLRGLDPGLRSELPSAAEPRHQEDFLRSAQERDRPDAFSPDRFNLRYHGRSQ